MKSLAMQELLIPSGAITEQENQPSFKGRIFSATKMPYFLKAHPSDIQRSNSSRISFQTDDIAQFGGSTVPLKFATGRPEHETLLKTAQILGAGQNTL